MYCNSCGAEINDKAVVCVKCGVPATPAGEVGKSAKTRVVYVLLGFFLGGFGIHNFYAGRTGVAVAQLLVTLCTAWLIFTIPFIWIWVIVELFTVTKDGAGKQFA